MKLTSIRKIMAFAGTVLLTVPRANAQQQYSTLWQPVKGAVPAKGEQVLHPSKFNTYRISEQNLKTVLASLSTNADAAGTIDLPTPDGYFRTFRIWNTPSMAPELARKYTDIQTFTAVATDNSQVTAKIDYTPFGFHAMIFDSKNIFFIDPYSDVADGNYMVYYRSDYQRSVGIMSHCEYMNAKDKELGLNAPTTIGQPKILGAAYRSYGTTKRKFRLAIACTGEYATTVNGPTPTKAGVLAKIVTTTNRVNGIFERELAYTMEIIGNNDTLINLDANTDPYTNLNPNALLIQNQTAIDARIKTANYDIGHVFCTGTSGIAQKASVCNFFYKAQGVTGSPNPVGDAFDIDFVAHEIGHQFGADHTFNNGTSGYCTGNFVPDFAYEPGSGSTLMAYGGYCAGNDYVKHSSFNFHSASLEQISIYITDSTNCAVTSPSGNQNATIPSYSATYSIPFLTPFELEAPEATDATADTLTYTWEERDLGDFGKSIFNTRLAGPLFRPFPPTPARVRVFPEIDSLLKNRFVSTGEKLPDTARQLKFRMTQRDIYQGFGCWNFPEDSIVLNVIHTGTPFKVTSPTSATNWTVNGTATITWDVSNTTAAPISCSAVDILLSVDGGYTFPYILKANTPNDGNEAVTLPNWFTHQARIKVKSVGNVFFSISSGDAKILWPAGVNNVAQGPEVTVSPVPATNTVSVKITRSNEALKARIVNAVGQKIWEGSVRDQEEIGVSGWAKGIYYMQLTNTSGSVNINKTLSVQ